MGDLTGWRVHTKKKSRHVWLYNFTVVIGALVILAIVALEASVYIHFIRKFW